MHLLLDGQLGRRQAVDAVVVAPERHPQLVQVVVEQRHVGAHPEGDVRGVLARDTGTDDDDLRVGDSADPAHQHAPATLGLHQAVGADLGRQAAGDLRHGVEQRQPTGRQLHRLVGDAGDLAVDQLLGEGLVGGQVEVGEQGQALVHAVVLLRDGLLDLEHHLGVVPDLVGTVEDLGAGRRELGVVDLRPHARALLDVHVVPVRGQLVHADGRDRHAVLVVLDFLRDADLHWAHSSHVRPPAGRDRSDPSPSHPSGGTTLGRSHVRSTLRQVSLARSSSDQPRSRSAASSLG